MEGWLQVPPERNLIGRAGWKTRYVRFTNTLPGTTTGAQKYSITSAARPTTAGSSSSLFLGSSGGSGVGSGWKAGLERSSSTNQITTLSSAAASASPSASPSAAAQKDGRYWQLAIYKQKNDADPIARYPIQKIASCYIGDMASSKKKSVVQRTLVINMRHEVPMPPPIISSSSASASRSFRRRSQETPTREASFRREGSAHMILLFRPIPESTNTLDAWKSAIQERLTPPRAHKSHISVIDYERFTQGEDSFGAVPASPSSLFLVNGEPSTALLSPSIRSRSSNLSSIESSDDCESYISSTSDTMSSPRVPGSANSSKFPANSPRPVLHLRTSSQRIEPLPTPPTPPAQPSTPLLTSKRETILDRFFSTAPPSPADAIKPGAKPMSSIARFEALMNDLDSSRYLVPSRPVSQPVSRPASPPSPPPPLPPRASVRLVQPRLEVDTDTDDEYARRDSDVSVDTVQSTLTQGSINNVNVLQPPQSKRHSLADFSMMQSRRVQAPNLGERRGSWNGEGVEERDEEESGPEGSIREGIPIKDEGLRLEFSGRHRGQSEVGERQKIFNKDFAF